MVDPKDGTESIVMIMSGVRVDDISDEVGEGVKVVDISDNVEEQVKVDDILDDVEEGIKVDDILDDVEEWVEDGSEVGNRYVVVFGN